MASSNNIVDQIASAVQNAVDSNDFSNLQSTIERTVNAAAQGIGRGIAQVSNGIREGQSQYALIQERKQRQAQMDALYANPSSPRGLGVGLIAAGCIVAIPLLCTGSLFTIVNGIAATVMLGVGAVAGAALIVAGAKKIGFAKRFERYRDAIGLTEACRVEDVAARCGEDAELVKKDLRKMVSKGLFKQATLDERENLLFLTQDSYQRNRAAQAAALEQSRKQALLGDAGKPAGRTAEQTRLLERGEAFIAKIRASNEAIPGEGISRTLDQIEHVIRAIFDVAADNPEVIDDLDQLMDYYLPTTVKLLDSYRELNEQPIQSERIEASKREIEGALSSLNTAFEKLLDSLFRDMAIDVSSDISVLHSVLAQDGLAEGPFDRAQRNGKQP